MIKLTKEHKNKSGVYQIVNQINNKKYIGSSSNLWKRRCDHLNKLKKDNHCNKYLQRSFNQHKEENFTFEILEECDLCDLVIKEQYWIDSFDFSTLYNNAKFVEKFRLNIEVTAETREKISRANKGKVAWNKGLTKETNDRLAEQSKRMKEYNHMLTPENLIKANLKKYGRICSEKTIKLKQENSPKNKPVLQFDKEDQFLAEFISAQEAARTLNKNTSSTISGCCNNRRKSAYGYKWKWK